MDSEIKELRERPKIRYATVFWLFILGSLLGVLIEGLWYAFDHGGWETHVVTIWGPFCIIYGFGMAGCYIGSVLMRNQSWWKRFLTFSVIGGAVEFVCGWTILKLLGMRAWDYSDKFMNIMGLTDFNMCIVWGMIGIVFQHAIPYIDKVMEHLHGRFHDAFLYAFTVFMAVDLVCTTVVLTRWSNRHWGEGPGNAVSRMIDERWPEERLRERYVEWWFTDEPLRSDGNP